MFEFIWGVLSGILQAFLFGGFIILGFKLYEWWSDRFYNVKVGKYLSKKKSKTYEISLPYGADTSIAEMEAFFNESSVISGNRSTSEIMSLGKWFFQICFDIVSIGGDVKMYLTAEQGRMDLLRSLLTKHYPDVIMKESPWPYEEWPEEWWNEDGVFGLKGYRGNDIVPAKSQIHPIKNYNEFYSKDGRLINDPMETLFSYLRTIPKDSIVAIQYHLRPWPAEDAKKKWKKDLETLREEFTNNAVVEKKGNSIVPITGEEEKILDDARKKIAKAHYRSKIRWFVIHDPKSKSLDPSMAAKGVSAYLQEFSTSQQKLGALREMNTDAKTVSGKYGVLDGIVSDKINAIYWMTRQKEYTMRRIYNGIRNRSGGFNGHDDALMSCADLAGLIHFPKKRLSQVEMREHNMLIQQQNPQASMGTAPGGVVIQQYQPAYYIQQDGSVASTGGSLPIQGDNFQSVPQLEVKRNTPKPPDNLPA
jgi:hypothetical protein